MNQDKLNKVLEDHKLWLKSEGGYKANLHCANLEGANLHCADLYRADLRSANLYCADLYCANLCGANLRGANLHCANLRSADLYRADLRGANLHCANLWGANLRGADLRDITMDWQSHNLISEILQRAAKTLEQRAVAGIVAKSIDWCWDDFIREFSDSQKAWAKSVLSPLVKEDDGAPEVLCK